MNRIYKSIKDETSYGTKPYKQMKNVTKESLLEKSFLDWGVEKRPIYYKNETGNYVEFFDKFATIRQEANLRSGEEQLGIVGSSYEVLQNEQLLEAVLPFFDIEDVDFETAGYFNNGKRVWMLFKLPEFIVVNGDKTEQMLFVGNSHDGTTSIHIGLTSVRVICGNTFQLAMKQSKLRIRHFESAPDKVKKAHEIIGITSKVTTQLNEIFNQMAKAKVTDKFIDEIVYKLNAEDSKTSVFDELSTRKQNSIITMKEFIDLEFSNSKALNGNKYGVFNGITAYYNHGTSKSNKEKRFEKMLFGDASKKMNQAFTLLTK